MPIRGWAKFFAAALGLTLACVAMRAQMPIPKTQGTTLAGTAVTLPDALKGKVNVLVVGFSHASQGQVANWGRLITAEYGQSHDLTYFELAMLAGAPKMLRGMIVKQMGSSVPYAEKPHFVPLTEGEPAWRAVAHYDKPDDAYVLVVDGTGNVLWQTEGDATDVAWTGFRETLDRLAQQASAP